MKLSNIFSRRNRILLAELVRTDFKLRYQASTLGYVWSILNPLLLFAILYVVFVNFLRIGGDIEHFPIMLLLGIVMWRFFAEATNNGLKAIVQRGGLIRKINFPKYIIVISGTISSLINLGLNFIVIFIFILISGVEVSWQGLLVLPLIIELYLFALALAFFLSAANAKLRDVGYIWEVFLQGAFYATPILYPLSIILERSELAAKVLMVNPVAQIIQDMRHVLISTEATTIYEVYGSAFAIMIPFTIIGVIGIFAGFYFKKSSKRFAEEV